MILSFLAGLHSNYEPVKSSQSHDGTWFGGFRSVHDGHENRGGYGGCGRQRDRGSLRCTYCGQENHTHENCWKLNGESPKFANNVYSPSKPESSGNISILQEEYSQLRQFKSAQQASHPTTSLAQLGNSIACFSSSLVSKSCILDFGTTNHMTGTSSLFTNLKDSPSSHVTLANGSTTFVSRIGYA
ncbi:Retrovirus-related Pol polyprotein from transposon TNT 1-94 [Quillaja saponaria]|uniref:Retrovirus-related Pol polyprotein from transposon TNT 1-94 n=1 Tax=Quillaja saponaria TaxID=32244 RepID=A0AAD7QDV5_QUISA|nr:Retrovirus-related Pol polyprotein from transposon TNT 1-94 [Quillaja saponaria]